MATPQEFKKMIEDPSFVWYEKRSSMDPEEPINLDIACYICPLVSSRHPGLLWQVIPLPPHL